MMHSPKRRLIAALALWILVYLITPVDARNAPSGNVSGDQYAATEVSSTVPRPELFASTSAAAGILFASPEYRPPSYSLNGGTTWNVVASAPWLKSPTTRVSAVAVVQRREPGVPVRLIVAVTSIKDQDRSLVGIYRSGDLGISWSRETFGDAFVSVWIDLFTSAADPTRLYAISTTPLSDLPQCYYDPESAGYPCTAYYSALYASYDSGLHWREITPENCQSLTCFVTFSVSPHNGDRIYAQRGRGDRTVILFRSDDGGTTWPSAEEAPWLPRGVDAAHPTWLYVVGAVSRDDGRTWSRWASTPCSTEGRPPNALVVHPTVSEALLYRCEDGIYRSIDSGTSWVRSLENPGLWLVADVSTPGRIMQMRNDGLWETTDVGLSWKKVATPSQFVTDIFVPFALK